jgi:selenocysteine-specific elongation factor
MVAEGPLRLPVDRVFSVTGFGTVVTGTLIAGSAATGDAVEILPRGINSRVRNIHVHGQKVDRAGAGQRVALNVTGVEVEQIDRGSVVASPGHLKPTYRMDIRLQLLESARALKNRARVRLYLGTAEIFGRVILLKEEELAPGKWTYAQLELEEEAVAAKGDRFVIRSYSPMRTIGGGSVIDTGPQKHKRYKKEIIDAIATREKGTPEELVSQALEGRRDMVTAPEIARLAGIGEEETGSTLEELCRQGTVRRVEGEGQAYYISWAQYQKWSGEIRPLLQKYHRQFPLREGFPKEELRSRMFGRLNNKQFQYLLHSLEADGIVSAGAATVADPGYVNEPGPELNKKIIWLQSKYSSSAMQPPSWKEATAGQSLDDGLAAEVLHFLIRKGDLVRVSEDIYFHASALEEARKRLAGFFDGRDQITVGEARDLFSTSRKYTLPLLEYFDREKVTRRVGDIRVPGREIKGRQP